MSVTRGSKPAGQWWVQRKGGVEDHPPGRFGDGRRVRSGGDVEAAVIAPVHVTPDQQQEGQHAGASPAGRWQGIRWGTNGRMRRCKNVGRRAVSLGFGMQFADGRTFVNPHSPCPFTRHRPLFLALAGLLLTVDGVAQGEQRVVRPLGRARYEEPKFRMGLHLLPSIAWLDARDGNTVSDGSIGRFGFGFTADIMFADNYAIGTGVNVFRNGGKLTTIERLTGDPLDLANDSDRVCGAARTDADPALGRIAGQLQVPDPGNRPHHVLGPVRVGPRFEFAGDGG